MGIFNRIRNFFRFGREGLRLSEKTHLSCITDHPKVGITKEEMLRIRDNKRLFAGEFDSVRYSNSRGDTLTRDFNYINTPKIFANHLTKLILNEGCKIKVENGPADDFLKDVFRTNKFMETLTEELEAGYAVNGLALRPYVRGDKVEIAFCSAGSFFPLKSNGNIIKEAVIPFKSELVENEIRVYYTLLEFHEWESATENYIITNELYRSEDKSIVGERVPLGSLERFAELNEQTVIEGLSRPLFTYIKLAGKNNITGSLMGLGIVDNAKPQIKNINETYDKFMFEISRSDRIITASEKFFKTRFDQKGRPIQMFDKNTSVFQKLNTDPVDGLGIQEFVPSLRSQEFIDSVNFTLRIAEGCVGFSSGTFSFDGHSVKTATEVVSENSKTYQTRAQNVKLLEAALRELITSIFEIAQVAGIWTAAADFEVMIDFDDGVFTDRNTAIDFYGKAIMNKIIPRQVVMQRLFKIPEGDAIEWEQQIMHEERRFSAEFHSTMAQVTMFGREE